MNSLLVTLAFMSLMGSVWAALYAAVYGGRRKVDTQMAELAVKMRIARGALDDEDETFGRVLLQWLLRRAPAPRPDTPKGEKLMHTLLQAGYPKATALKAFGSIRLAFAAGGALGGLILSLAIHADPASAAAFVGGCAVVGGFIPSYYVGHRARRRQVQISRELSDVLDLLVVCVEAGLGVQEALSVVGTEAERHGQVIGRELSLVTSEVSSGATLGEALRNFADRTAVDDIRPLAATLIQSEQLGAQIAPALRASSDALRARRRLNAEEAAHKTAVKILFPLVLFVLPAMLILIIGPALIQIVRTLTH